MTSTRSSLTGTNYTDIDKNMSPKEICEIIRVSGELGVCEFSYKDLKFSFNQKIEASTSNRVEIATITTAQAEVSRETSLEDAREEFLGELLLSNPSEYERIREKEDYLDAQNEQRAESMLRGSKAV